METSEKPLKTPNKNNDDVATSSSSKVIDSPKTPVQTFDSSFEDEDTDEMESPKFPHLIPVYHRRTPNEYDLEGVRIGWDDGFGSVCYQDDDYIVERNGKKRLMRNRRNRLFSEHRHRSFFGTHKNSSQNSNSPSPGSSSNIAVIQAELNDYLGCILNCLSAKKRKRQLMKLKNEENSTNNSTENNISRLLDDSADDEMMLLCSQAIEKTIAADTNSNVTNKSSSTNSLSIPGISPLKDTNDNVYHTAKKFKPIHCSKLIDVKKNDDVKSLCHTITSSSVNKLENTNNTSNTLNTVTNSNKGDSSLLLNDSLANDEDELFSAIDLSAIEQDILFGDNKTLSESTMAKSDIVGNKQPQNTNIDKQMENKSNHCTSNNSSSLLWRKCTSSSSIINTHLQMQNSNQKSFDINGTKTSTNSNFSGSTEDKPTMTRYCTPAEIEAKRDRARRTLMLKFKSKNKSAM